MMAKLQNPEIIVNNEGEDGTLRSAAAVLGIHAITVEAGDPQLFQEEMVLSGLEGIFNVMSYLNMIDDPIIEPYRPHIYCHRSYWVFADRGGILEVFPPIASRVCKGNKIAVIKDIFGKVVKEYAAPENGVVIGKRVNPVNQTNGRMLHLGIYS